MTIIAAGPISKITWLADRYRIDLSWKQQMIAVHPATLDSISSNVHMLVRRGAHSDIVGMRAAGLALCGGQG